MKAMLWMLFAALRVWIAPPTLALAPGESLRVQVEVREGGTVVTPDTLWFEVLPPRLGHIEDGVFHAGRPGVGVLRAVARVGQQEAVGHAAVQISRQAHRLRVLLNPREVKLSPGGSVPFQIQVRAPDGREAVHARIQVQVVPPWLGTWHEGTFTAGSIPGRGMLVVVARSPEGPTGVARARIQVGSGRPGLRFRVHPRFLELKPGAHQEIQVEVPGVPQDRLEVFLYPDPPDLGRAEGQRFTAARDTLRGVLWVAVRTPDGRSGIQRIPVAVGQSLPRFLIQPPRLHGRPRRWLRARLVPQDSTAPPGRFRPRMRGIRWQVVPRGFARVEGRGPRVRVRVQRPGVGLLVARWHEQPLAAAPIFAAREIPAEVRPQEVRVGEDFQVIPVDPPSEPRRFLVLPPHRAEPLGQGRFRARESGPLWVLVEGNGWASAVHLSVRP